MYLLFCLKVNNNKYHLFIMENRVTFFSSHSHKTGRKTQYPGRIYSCFIPMYLWLQQGSSLAESDILQNDFDYNMQRCTWSHSLFQFNLAIEFSVTCADTEELQRIVLMGKKRAAFYTRRQSCKFCFHCVHVKNTKKATARIHRIKPKP